MKKIIRTNDAPAPIGPYSQAVQFNNLLFVSGQIAIDPNSGAIHEQTISAQAKQVMKNINSILNEAGFEFKNVVKTSIFLQNMDDFNKVNEVYGSFFTGDYPARETIEVRRLPKDVLVEISVIAAK
jgi:2-iminobutanoate/2-iminopropanoate deaminase